MGDRRGISGPRLLLPLLLLGAASGLPDGAPATSPRADVCQTLRPLHGSHQPQLGPAPYRLTAEEDTTDPGGRWLVTLTGDRPFRGLLLQARAAAGTGTTPLGRFEKANGTHLLDCSGKPQSALTHSSDRIRDSLRAIWHPDDASRQVQFIATVVEGYRDWWEDVRSETILVAGASGVRSASLQGTSPSDVQDVYSGCFTEYGCFGAPAGCEATKECDVIFTYVADSTAIRMGLMAKQDGQYAAVGVSEDATMRSDGVIVCGNSVDAPPKVYYGYNADTGRHCSLKSEASPAGTSAVETWEKDGHFMCSFTQDLNLVIPTEKTFDLGSEHFLLVATGGLDESLALSYHSGNREVSAGPVNLTDTSSLKVAGVPPLIKAHGTFMLIAWIGTAGIGILSAQFFRETWVGKKVLGTDVWFTIHRAMMVVTAVCTWLGFTFIAIELGGLDFDHDHNIVGFVVFLLTIVQVLGALVRPHPGTPLRPLFAWGHRLTGVSAYLLAITALLLAQQLAKTKLPRYWFWVVVAAVGIHLIISLLLLVVSRCVQSELAASPQVRPDSSGPAKSEAPGSPIRKALLGFYIVSSFSFVVALVAILIVSTA